nr:tetratricopeptide repeat protein [uncultured Desulfobulbus sp.]
MAAMFFIFSLYSYIQARKAYSNNGRTLYFFLSFLYATLALGCKENAITIIPSLFLAEYLFFYKSNDRFSTISLSILLILTTGFILAGIYYIINHNLLSFLNEPIGSRPFSIGERLLTQPSILLFYLTLLIFPSPERLSIDHSFPLSTSLWHPWTTLPAIIIVLGLIIFSLVQGHRKPILSFAILFFFINHLVESTIIPLEMIFEHRNYLPSMFLFVPIATGLCRAIEKSKQSQSLVHSVLLLSIPVLLMTLGLGTFSRNNAWASEESLWTDALAKAPTNARAYAKLGEIYGWQKEKTTENLQIAVALLEKAIHLESPRTSFKAAVVGNIGKVYYNYGLLDQAVSNYKRSLSINPNFITSRFDLANALTHQGKFAEALKQINRVIAKNDLQSRFYNLKALLLLRLNRAEDAAIASSQAIHRTMVNKERYYYNCGVSLTRAGYLKQGYWFLKQGLQLSPGDKRILYSLIENRIIAKDTTKTVAYAEQLVHFHSLAEIKADFLRIPSENAFIPVDIKAIAPIILQAAQQSLTTLKQV